MFQEFPKFRYAADGRAVIVDSAEDELALEGEWFDTPWAAAEAKAKPDAEPSKEDLQTLADELGVKYDKRWGAERIAEAIAQHKAAQE